MKIDFRVEEKVYQTLATVHSEIVASATLFNQQLLTAGGKLHAALLQLNKAECEKFIADNADFFDAFPWRYYVEWREKRAKSMAHCFGVYDALNVGLSVSDCVGETFYAGIPLVTIAEVNDAIDKHDTDTGPAGFAQAKIGIDGKLHPCDEQGCFPDIVDFNDVYADGSMVAKSQLGGSN